MEFIYLNKEQAEKVRGRHGIYSALDPIETDDKCFVLPREVLNDKEHTETFPDLLQCKVAEIDIIDSLEKGETKQTLCVKGVSKDILSVKLPVDWKKYDTK